MHLRLNLTSTKKGSLLIAHFFQKMKTFGDALLAIGQPLTDSELISYILVGLSPKYDSLITSLTTRLDPMSLQEVYGHLLTYELRLEHQNTTLDITVASVNTLSKGKTHAYPSTKGPDQLGSSTRNFSQQNFLSREKGRGRG